MTALKLANFAKLFPSTLAKASQTTTSLCHPLYSVQTRGVGDLKDRGIEWREPKRLHFLDPEPFGDLAPLYPPDKSRPVLEMAGVMEAYDKSPPIVQRLLSLEFAHHNQTLKTAQYDLCRKVQYNQYDFTSRVAGIARLTVDIRYYQQPGWKEVMDINAFLRRSVKAKVFKRGRMLRRLREYDYKLFEYVLEKLDLRFTPVPEQVPKTVEKHDALRNLVKLRCERIRKRRMAVYQKVLAGQREGFVREKKETLDWIMAKELELGMAVTVDPEAGVVDNRMPENPPIMRPDVKPKVQKWVRSAQPFTLDNV